MMNKASVYRNEGSVLYQEPKMNVLLNKKKIRKERQKKEQDMYSESPFDHHYTVISRLKRFGIGIEKIWNLYVLNESATLDKIDFIKKIDRLDKDSELIMLTSLYVYLIDQMFWGYFSEKETIYESNTIIDRINSRYEVANEFCQPCKSREQAVAEMINCYATTLASIVEQF